MRSPATRDAIPITSSETPKKKNMLVSVVIPAWNAAEYLREAIESVLAQTYKDLEIIVVDDGSTDDTRQICAHFEPQVKYCYQPNDGTHGAGARARAILEAKGEWVALLDQDDRWFPRKIEKQLQALRECPTATVAFTGFHEIDPQGRIVSEPFLGAPSGDVFHSLLTGNPYRASSALLSRSVLDHCGLPITDVGAADYDLWLRIAKRSQILVVDECLTEYRIHETAYSADRRRLVMAVRRTLEQHKNQLHPNCPECQRSFRKGWSLISKLAARACLDEYHVAAKSGELSHALGFLREAIQLAPRQVFRPRQFLAVSKNLGLAMIRLIVNGLATTLEV